MQGADVSYKLGVLEEQGFIQRTTYNADEGIARSYTLMPDCWTTWRTQEFENSINRVKKARHKRKSIV